MYESIPPYQRDARSKGIPQLGSGAIYPVPESEITVQDFPIPTHFRRGYGFDVGWNRTAAIFGALDIDSDVLYLYSEHYRGQAEPSVHAAAIKARGAWIPGRIDPAARGRGQRDGEQLLKDYKELGLDIMPAVNAREAGLYKVWMRLSTGRLKVFASCQSWLGEFRIYRRDEKGHIVKESDHLMDGCLVPGTLVVTDQGLVPISELVGKTGKVLSRCGAWLDYVGARKTMSNTKVIKLMFSNGDEVICTPDHPFLTGSGWVEAKDMLNKSCYNGVTQRIKWKSWLTQMSSLTRLKNLMVSDITNAANTISAMASGCTEWCGNRITAISRTGIMSTIKTKTRAITMLVIWLYYQARITSASTSQAITEVYQPMLLRPQRNGMDQKLAGNGINSTTSILLINSMCSSHLNAKGAGLHLPLYSGAVTDFVPITVNRNTGWRPALIMRNVVAWFVAACLWRIAILKNKHAADDALLFCHAVTDAGLSDVYCLTVPGASAFCVNSGMVVHNTRYLVQECESNDFMITKPVIKHMSNTSAPVFDPYANY